MAAAERSRAARIVETGDGMWLALLDVPRALAARSYERTGSWSSRRSRDAARTPSGATGCCWMPHPMGATCVATDQAADLVVDARALAAAYLGGARLRDTVLLQGADEQRAGALAEADALLRTAERPWSSTAF